MFQAPISNRPRRNFSSNIELTDQPIKVPIKYSFQNISQMKQLINNQSNIRSEVLDFKRNKQKLNYHKNTVLPLTTNQRYQNYTSKNTITQQNQQFKIVPMQTNPNSKNEKIDHQNQYKNWLAQHKKFTKPYSQMTRYVDSLSQNKNLIRRGQFDMPLHKDSYQSRLVNNQRHETLNSSISTSSNQYKILPLAHQPKLKSITQSQSKVSFNLDYKPLFKTKKEVSQSLNTLQPFQLNESYKNHKCLSNGLKNTFDRSLNGCLNKYQTLIKMERKFQEDQILLKNSMNKLIAIEEINHKINSKNILYKNNKKKLKKLKNYQQKFLEEENYSSEMDRN